MFYKKNIGATMTYHSSYFSQMDRQTDRQTDRQADRHTEIYTYIFEYVQVEHVKIIRIIGLGGSH